MSAVRARGDPRVADAPPAPAADAAAGATLALAERIDALETTVARLRAAVALLEARLDAAAAPSATETPSPRPETAPVEPPRAEIEPVALAGRFLIALGVGYVLRAATEAGVWSPAIGAAAGLAYAAALLAAGRDAARSGRWPAPLLATAAAALVAYPLLWEAVTRFATFGVAPGVAVGVAFCAAALAVSPRPVLGPAAWIHVPAATLLVVALFLRTHALVPAVLALAALSLALEGPLRRAARGVRWVAALALDAGLLALVALSSRAEGLPASYPPLAPGVALTMAIGVPLVIGAWIVARVRRTDATAYDVTQAGAAVALVGFACARLAPERAVLAAAAALGGALLLHAAALAAATPSRSRRALAAGGTALAMAGSAALLDGTSLALAWSLTALVIVATRTRDARGLPWHAVLLAAAALERAGVPALLLRVMAGAEVALAAGSLAAMLATVAAYAEVAWLRPERESASLRLAWSGLALVAVVAAAGGALAALPALRPAAATIVLSVLGALLFVSTRRTEWRALGIACLALAGLRLIAWELPRGGAVSVFPSLLAYGAALIAVQARGRASR